MHEIPEVDLDAILAGRTPPARPDEPPHEDGELPDDDARALLAILAAESPREVLEIGTFMGRTARRMAEALGSATVHTVDLPPRFALSVDFPKDDFHLIARRDVGRDYRGRPCEPRIRQHLADTAEWDFREAGSPTFFLVDGSHTYEYCRNDSEKCLALCGGRGVFLWHDCDDGHPGVVRLLAEWRGLGRDVRRIAGTKLAHWKGT